MKRHTIYGDRKPISILCTKSGGRDLRVGASPGESLFASSLVTNRLCFVLSVLKSTSYVSSSAEGTRKWRQITCSNHNGSSVGIFSCDCGRIEWDLLWMLLYIPI